MSPLDLYEMTNKLDDSLLQVVVTRLEARGKHPFFEKIRLHIQTTASISPRRHELLERPLEIP
jgi:hypothetical protein